MATTDADFALLLAGSAPDPLRLPDGSIESPEVIAMLRALAATIRPTFAPASWMMVDRGEIVGLCSIVAPPTAGVVPIGYGVAASRRGRGCASAAVAALLDWARADPRVLAVSAETSVDNRPSQRVLEANGFTRQGFRHDDEDGDLICWRRTIRPDCAALPLPPASAPR